MQIEKKVLALRENYRPTFVGSTGEIVDRESGSLFVKGIYIAVRKLCFHNFEDVKQTETAIVLFRRFEGELQNSSRKFPINAWSKQFQKKYLEPDEVESSFYDLRAEHPSVWVEGF